MLTVSSLSNLLIRDEKLSFCVVIYTVSNLMRRLHEDRGQWLRTTKYTDQHSYNKTRRSGEVFGHVTVTLSKTSLVATVVSSAVSW